MPLADDWTRHRWPAMGSHVELLAWGADGPPYVGWAVNEVERFEQCWSRFRPDSELSRLNASAGRPFACSELLWAAVERAATGWRETDGRFDPTVGPTLAALGYDKTFNEVSTVGDAVTAPRPIGFGAVELDPDRRTVTLPPGGALDLGGIGKGLTADRLVDGLLALGATSALVSAGGDIKVGGPGPDEDGAWMIDVENPVDETVLVRFPLLDEALVQSTVKFRAWERGGRRLHHLIDPSTGWPADTGIISVIVTGPEAWRAEVMAKAALVYGEHGGLRLLERTGHDGWMLREDGHVVATDTVSGDITPTSRTATIGEVPSAGC